LSALPACFFAFMASCFISSGRGRFRLDQVSSRLLLRFTGRGRKLQSGQRFLTGDSSSQPAAIGLTTDSACQSERFHLPS
jgi:hypothetical protein